MFDPLALMTGGIGALANLAGGAIAADAQGKATKETNETNLAIARENTAFQERMANTAHQREMHDLRMAGLNPILAAGASGAASPPGSVARMEPANTGGIIAEAFRGAGSSAAAAAGLEKQWANLDADTANKVTDGLNKLQSGQLIGEQVKGQRIANARDAAISSELVKQAGYTTQSKSLATAKEQAELPAVKERSRITAENALWDKRIEQVGDFLGNITSALNISNLFRTPTVRAGSKAEHRALERAGSRGLPVKR